MFRRVLTVAVLILVLLPLNKFIRTKLDNQQAEFSNVYSDGWFEYSFRYPNNAKITRGDAPSFGAGVYIYRQGERVPICNLELYRNWPYHDNYIDQTYGRITPDEVLTFNGLVWKRERIQNNSFIYGFKSTVWFALTKEYMYKVIAQERRNEEFCRKILSTVNPVLDTSIQSAVESQQIKKLALDYAKTNFPDKHFFEGSSLNNNAVVMFSSATTIDQLSDSSKFVHLAQSSGKWTVTRVLDHRQ